jgi:membrane protease YdiL (CAAX protease family)
MTEARGDLRAISPVRRARYFIEGLVVALTPFWLNPLIPPSWYPAQPVAANLAFVLVMWLSIGFGWIVLRLRGEGLADIGLRRPKSWVRTIGLGVLIGLGIFGASLLRDAIGAKPDVTSFGHLQGDLPLTLSSVAVGFLGAGISEEFVFRGVAMNSFFRSFQGRPWAWPVAIGLQAVLFSMPHMYMGLDGVIWAGTLGASLGVLFRVTGGNLPALMIAHGLHNTLKMFMFYTGLSTMS